LKRGSVLGLLGENGCGKTTCIQILSGEVKPNFGNFNNESTTADIIKFYRGTLLQNYFIDLYKGKLKIIVKRQNLNYVNGKVEDLFDGLMSEKKKYIILNI
jgi:ATP-binding cassette subfamily E protein 1